jgi:AcrR family transcriptional regulator
MTDPTRALRKDAELNRQRLLTAGAELFAARGLEVTLDDIARHAGVGVGTAYRRFPNKQALIDALFEQRLTDVGNRATDALQNPDAWRGLTTFLEDTLRMQLEDRGLQDLLRNPHLGPHRIDEARDRIAPMIDTLVERAKAQGSLREDVEGTDAIFLQIALAAVMDSSRGVSPELYRRHLTIFLDGLRAIPGPRTPLPVEALTVEQTHAVMSRHPGS